MLINRRRIEYYCHSCDNRSFYLSDIIGSNSIHARQSRCLCCDSAQFGYGPVKVQSREVEVLNRKAAYDAIYQHMERLGWTYRRVRVYLTPRYGCSAYSQLNDQQLIEFLRYLESKKQKSATR